MSTKYKQTTTYVSGYSGQWTPYCNYPSWGQNTLITAQFTICCVRYFEKVNVLPKRQITEKRKLVILCSVASWLTNRKWYLEMTAHFLQGIA